MTEAIGAVNQLLIQSVPTNVTVGTRDGCIWFDKDDICHPLSSTTLNALASSLAGLLPGVDDDALESIVSSTSTILPLLSRVIFATLISMSIALAVIVGALLTECFCQIVSRIARPIALTLSFLCCLICAFFYIIIRYALSWASTLPDWYHMDFPIKPWLLAGLAIFCLMGITLLLIPSPVHRNAGVP